MNFNKEPGYVYILTNPSFREDWVKIGKRIELSVEHRPCCGSGSVRCNQKSPDSYEEKPNTMVDDFDILYRYYDCFIHTRFNVYESSRYRT